MLNWKKYTIYLPKYKNEIPNITDLATNADLNAAEKKMPNVSNLVKVTDYITKINEDEKEITDHNHDKYIATPEFNKLTSENFAERLKQANLAGKSDNGILVNKTDFDNKLSTQVKKKVYLLRMG